MYKELNSDVSIKFPIKVDIAQHPHKVSLLIQSELGGSIFPNHDKWKKHKTQFNVDKNMVFSHVNRLIRCIIDCQLHLEDAVSVRHALELARSLAARVWDNSPFQMKQIEAIGDVGVRKLAQAGISSIETLQNTEPYRIENILGRNPPFGQKVLAKAVEFPSLRVSVKEMGVERHPGHWVKIKFKAEVGFLNERLPILFRKKSVYICFLAETSDGKLIDFRRFAAKKLENGQEIFLSVQLVRSTTSINCHIMCDEIAGTSRRAELHLEQLPASYFPVSKSIAPEPSKANMNARYSYKTPQESENYGDLDDTDLLAILDNEEDIEVIHDIDQIGLDSNTPAKKSLKRTAGKISTEQEGELKSYKEPIQLANGNWTCQHTCKEDGKSCKHKCCVDGVEKPAKPGRKKPAKQDNSAKSSTEDMAQKKAAKSTPFDKAQTQAGAKKQKLMIPSTHEAKGSVHRYHEIGTRCEPTSPALPKLPTHRSKGASAPKLPFMQNPYGLSNNLAELVETFADEEEDKCKDLNVKPQERLDDHSTGISDDLFDFDVDDEMASTTVEEMISLADHGEISKPPDSVGGKNFISTKQQHGEDSDMARVQETNVLTGAHRRNTSNHRLVGPVTARILDNRCYPATARSVVSIDKAQNPLSQVLSNEADFGAFNAPLTHLAPTATQRRAPIASIPAAHQPQTFKPQGKALFITGESSSPDKVLPRASKAVEDGEDYADIAVEAFFATLEAADYDVVDPPAKKQKLVHNPGELIQSAKGAPELQTSSTRTSSSLGESEMSRQPLATLQNSRNQLQTALVQNVFGADADMPVTEEGKEKEIEEEQGKKWEGLGDFYEQFGDYVEIVD